MSAFLIFSVFSWWLAVSSSFNMWSLHFVLDCCQKRKRNVSIAQSFFLRAPVCISNLLEFFHNFDSGGESLSLQDVSDIYFCRSSPCLFECVKGFELHRAHEWYWLERVSLLCTQFLFMLLCGHICKKKTEHGGHHFMLKSFNLNMCIHWTDLCQKLCLRVF
jgi:hypothetical protein